VRERPASIEDECEIFLSQGSTVSVQDLADFIRRRDALKTPAAPSAPTEGVVRQDLQVPGQNVMAAPLPDRAQGSEDSGSPWITCLKHHTPMRRYNESLICETCAIELASQPRAQGLAELQLLVEKWRIRAGHYQDADPPFIGLRSEGREIMSCADELAALLSSRAAREGK
jgi:hypothetical protein